MRVAVIGGNGFLGRYVAADLRRHGYDVCVMDVHDGPQGDFDYRRCDITDLAQVELCRVLHRRGVHPAGPVHLAHRLDTPCPA
jgi:nucleoside-diphosphate-sugar epimerase